MRDKSPSLLKFFTLVQGAERDPGLNDTLFVRSISVRLLEPGHLWKKIIQSQRFLRTKDSQGFLQTDQ